MNRRIVVTGGGTGIGYAIALRLCAEAPRLHLVGRRKEVLADAAARLVVAGASQVTIHSCDLTDAAAVEELAADLAGDPIEGLVLSAGGNIVAVERVVIPQIEPPVEQHGMRPGVVHTIGHQLKRAG